MQQIVNFLIKYRNLLLYILLLGVSVTFTVQTHSFHRNSFISSANGFTGSILNTQRGIYGYFDLADENKLLQAENAALRMRLLEIGDTLLGKEEIYVFSDSIPYKIFPARVIKNNYAFRDNFLTIDIGKKQGVDSDMGVFTPEGIVGVVDKSSKNFTRVISILNTQLSIAAEIKGTSTIGSLNWDGKDPYLINLQDVPRLAKVKKGDTIVTGSLSTIFPPGILIGTIEDAQLVANDSRYEIQVRLLNDMTDLGSAYVIKYRDQQAIKSVDTLGQNE
jgi:rod shape-determining protein MreC